MNQEDLGPLPSANQPAKLTDWANEPSPQLLRQDLEMAKLSHDSQVSKIQGWNDLMYIRGKAKPSKVAGRSSVQPKLIRRQAEWRYSAMTEPFLGTQKMFQVSPTTWEDKAAAIQNELLLNWQFRTKMNKVKLVDDFVRSAVDDGTCICQIGWCRETRKVKEEVPVYSFYDASTDPTATEMLAAAAQMKIDNPNSYEQSTPDEIKQAVDYYNETGQITIAVVTGSQEVEVDKVIRNHPTVDIIHPNNFYVDPSCNGDFSKALFVVVSFETNHADLAKYPNRYKNLDKVNWEGNTTITDSDHASSTPDDFQFTDKNRKKVVAYEYWGSHDINGDGSLVPIVATWIGDVMIRMEENPFPDQQLPFVLVPYLPVKRELYGEPDAELLEDNQKILGAVTRGMIDLLGRSANGQQGMAKGMLDPLNRRRYDNGQDYEFNPSMSPANGVIEHKFPDIPQSALLMLNLQNQEAEALTGVKSFAGGISGEAYGDVAAGIRGVLDAASKREMAILRRLAKGMTEIGNKIIAMNAVFLSEKEVIRVTNKEFITVKREDLIGNFDLETDISTAEVDNAKAQDLAFMLQTLGPNSDPGIVMMILAEIADLKRMPELANKLRNWRPQPSPEQQELQRLEIEKARKEVEKLQSEISLNNAKAQEALANKDQKNLDYVEQETGTKHARDMEKQRGQAQGNQALEITKALTKPLKEGEQRPNLEAAIGFNQLSDRLADAGTLQTNFAQPAPIPTPA